MTGPHDTLELLTKLVDGLRDTAEHALAMLEEREEVDPIFLMDACATAGLLESATLDDDTRALRDRLYRAVQSKPGRGIFAECAKTFDLGPGLDLDPDEEPLEQAARLQRLVELGGLATLADPPTRARLEDLVERNAGIVLADFERFEELYEDALFLRDAVPVSRHHLVRQLIDDVVAATAPMLWDLDEEVLQDELDAAHAQALASIPWWQHLQQWAVTLGDRVTDFLGAATMRPLPLAAASHGPERAQWPPPRLVLSSDPRGELALLGSRDGVLLEWFGELTPTGADLVGTDAALPQTIGPLPTARYWRLELPPDLAHEPQVSLHFESDSPVRASLARTIAVSPSIPNEARFATWRAHAPGAARALLAALTSDPSAARRAEAALSARHLALRDVTPEIGVGHFPVVTLGADSPGNLASVRFADALYRGPTLGPTQLAPVIEALGAVCGVTIGPDGLVDAGARRLVIAGLPPDAPLEGRSWELAALGALASRLLGEAPRQALVASGALRGAYAFAVDHLDAKRQTLARECPETPATLVESDTPLSEVLALWFGPDAIGRLQRALRASPAALAQQAVQAWSVDEREHGAALARAALGGGVQGLDRADALWVLGAALLHRAETRPALDAMSEARAIYGELARTQRIRRYAAEEIESYLAIGHLDHGHPRRALALLEPTLLRLDAVAEPDRDQRWDEVRVQVAGSLARAGGFLGELDRAISLLRESLAISNVPDERARTLGDLAELLRRRDHSGDLDEARVCLEQADAALADIGSEQQRARTARFLRLYRWRVGLADPSAPIVPASWSDWPQPAETVEALLTTDPASLTRWLDAQITDAPPIGLVVFRGALARAIAVFGEDPHLLASFDALAARLAGTDLDAVIRDLRRGEWREIIARTPY